MTCREMLALEHPNHIGDFDGGCRGCPSYFYYMPDPEWCGTDREPANKCTICWDREIPGTEANSDDVTEAINNMYEKETSTMEQKTKAQLIEEINNLQEKIEKLDRYRQYELAATELHVFYESFVNAGFTKEQAWELFMSTAKVGIQAAFVR